MYLILQPPFSIKTISDIESLFWFIFYLPGNLVISWTASYPKAAYFFEINESSGDGTTSFIISCFFWFISYFLVSAFFETKEVEEYL
jgi:hypothetical protein